MTFPTAMFHLTLIRAVIKKDVDMWLGVIFDSPGNQKETGKCTAISKASLSYLERDREPRVQ